MEVRVRYAPSPTGFQHIGGVRTALFNYFFARANGGKFILRIEDTDRTRYSEAYVQDLYDTLDWLGIKWDEGPVVGGPYGPYVQSERTAIYQEYAKKLVEMGKAYYCYCSPERLEALRKEQEESHSQYQGYDRHCLHITEAEKEEALAKGIKPVIRLIVPTEGKTTFHDVLMGDITRRNRDVSPDPILLKSDGFPTYHLANVIDDHLMRITHIMRAQEWIPSGPLHVLLYQAFGWEPPVYCHLPMVLGKDGQKLSKRHGSTSVREFREKGYLPEAIMNYVSLVGWSYDGQKQFFSKEELERLFDMNKINKSSGVFDYKKLDWFNGQYIRQCDDERLKGLLAPYLEKAGFFNNPPTEDQRKKLDILVPVVKERMKLLGDVVELSRFLFQEVSYSDPALFCDKKTDLPTTVKALEQGSRILENGLKEKLPSEEVEARLCELATSLGVKVNGVFMPIRVALTGSQVSLPLFDSIKLLGEEQTRARLQRALDFLHEATKN